MFWVLTQNLSKFWYNLSKIKILHSQKHSISYDYDVVYPLILPNIKVIEMDTGQAKTA